MTDKYPVDDAVKHVGQPVRRRGSRRVVMLSDVDAKRIESGEFASVEEVLHATDQSVSRKATPRQEVSHAKENSSALSPHDREILGEVPPHFGKI